MPIRSVYLTIDDAPSIHMKEMIDFLRGSSIPALFFCRGEFIQARPESVLYAIQNGYIIGNHSYSHPYFSETPLGDCFSEILKTEELIEKCYQRANTLRPHKIVRLPFGDRGAGPSAQSPKTLDEERKIQEVQNFLRQQGFQPVKLGSSKDNFVDVFWDWDTQDYKTEFIESPNLYKNQLMKVQQNSSLETAVLLLHDFDWNYHLFHLSMKFLKDKNITFLPIDTLLEPSQPSAQMKA